MTPEDLEEIGAFLQIVQQRVRDFLAEEMKNTPKTEEYLAELKKLGIAVLVEYGCSVKIFVSDDFRPPKEIPADLDELFNDTDKEWLKAMGL